MNLLSFFLRLDIFQNLLNKSKIVLIHFLHRPLRNHEGGGALKVSQIMDYIVNALKRLMKSGFNPIGCFVLSRGFLLRVVWIAQCGKMLVFTKEVLGSNPGANHIPGVFRPPLVEMWILVKKLIKDGQSLQFACTDGQ